MLVEEAMTKNVITIHKEKTVLDACNMYQERKVGCLLVTDSQGDCVGIVTERDIIERTICAHYNPEQTQVCNIMTSDIKTVPAKAKLEKAVEIMNEYNIKKLPVLQEGEVVGIITVTDLSRALPQLTKRSMENKIKPIWKE
ncbi:MAG: CBS domain-containing protein [Candidatus Thermoplasmatota archaeon]|nr:CBS domain-containing protein [Candidatus Thermoplasmatota archaeon]